MTILSLAKKSGDYEKFFRGDVPSKAVATAGLIETFGVGCKTTGNTNLRKLCEEKAPYLKRALEIHIRDYITDQNLYPLRGKKRGTIKNRYKCADSDFFDEIIDCLIENGEIEERNGRLWPPEKITKEAVERELLPQLLLNKDKDAWKVLDQLDKKQEWKDIGKKIIGEMEDEGSLETIDGRLRPYFLNESIFCMEHQHGRLTWKIPEDKRFEIWQWVIYNIKISGLREEPYIYEGEQYELSPALSEEIDPSNISYGTHSFSVSLGFIEKEKEEEVKELNHIEIASGEIIILPPVRVFQASETDKKIIEVGVKPDVLKKMDFQMFEVQAGTSVFTSNREWIQKEGNSYTLFEGEVGFSLKCDGKDLSSWIEERPLKEFFESFLKISIQGADGPDQNCECEVKADNVIFELFDKGFGEMTGIYVNDEKAEKEEKFETRCFSAWRARQSEYRVEVKIDFERGSLALEEETVRVPFPEPRIDLAEDWS